MTVIKKDMGKKQRYTKKICDSSPQIYIIIICPFQKSLCANFNSLAMTNHSHKHFRIPEIYLLSYFKKYYNLNNVLP